MKKRIQKYLSGSNEGFSLVELIIVIAIMAILVGVVALAVIPNLERSRESKDLTTLDSACSALAVAVANAGNAAGASGSFDLSTVASGTAGSIQALMYEQIGDMSKTTLSSAVAQGLAITCEYDTTQNICKVYVGDGTIKCKYAKDDQGNPAVLLVTN